MSERKLRQTAPGEPKPALTRLKELGAAERATVMSILRTNRYEEARALLAERVGFECSKGALSRFFAWQAKQEAMREAQDIVGQAERFMQRERPEWTEEKVREVAGTFFMMRAMGNRDASEFLKFARLGVLEKHEELESRKLDFHRKKFEHQGNFVKRET